jgi:hypothetical protein
VYYFNKFTLAAEDLKHVKNKMIQRKSSELGAKALGRKNVCLKQLRLPCRTRSVVRL